MRKRSSRRPSGTAGRAEAGALFGVRDEGPAHYRPPGTPERLRRGRRVRAWALRRPSTMPELWWRSAVPKNELPVFRKAFR